MAAPSVTSLPSCGHPVMVSPTSSSEAAPREETSAAPSMRSTYGAFCCDRQAGQVGGVQTRPSSPWKTGRSGSRSKRSTSSTPAVAGLHQHGDAALPGRLAHEELHVERVALLDHQVEAVEEGAEVVGGDALGDRHHPQVGVDLADPAGRHDRLVDAQVEDAARDAVEVGQLDVSKSASRSSPARPSMARTWAIEWPALSPTTPMRRVRWRACSARVSLLRLRSSRSVPNERGPRSRTTARRQG